MDHKEQTKHFAQRLDSLIDYCAKEYNLTFAQIIGVMQIKAIELVINENKDSNEEE